MLDDLLFAIRHEHSLAGISIIFSQDQMAAMSPERAEEWFRGLVIHLESIMEFPRRCPIARAARAYGADVRELIYGKRPNQVYRVLYLASDDLIRVLAIRHGSEKPRSH